LLLYYAVRSTGYERPHYTQTDRQTPRHHHQTRALNLTPFGTGPGVRPPPLPHSNSPRYQVQDTHAPRSTPLFFLAQPRTLDISSPPLLPYSATTRALRYQISLCSCLTTSCALIVHQHIHITIRPCSFLCFDDLIPNSHTHTQRPPPTTKPNRPFPQGA
jgi:hypothetical protein